MTPIPLIDENDFLLEATLEDVTYFLHFSWNSEARFWVMGIRNANSDVLIQGVVMAPNVALLAYYRAYALPPGEFVAYAEDMGAALDRDSFRDGRAVLFYLTEAEYAAL
jgi:hypothetical protein